MKPILALVLSSFLPFAPAVSAQGSEPEPPMLVQPGEEADLASFLWHKRPIVVFADSPEDPRFKEQMARLTSEAEALLERDVVVLTDTTPKPASALRKQLRPRGFMLVLVGKDGGVKLRKPHPWTVRELSRSIDKFQDRLQEVEDRREN
ncbi:DUF4174 domain-containing protein [Pseudophaeobacter arcticus]|jgi:hypothetical protein|uniref:DUF4174 domain-containing protein n=1 Tax=Pseudophaeobacter arcticus TaxID=385492 RepID=UPI0004866D7B|nr:DUF4174 domain-containing protein [Pseudophaeobacter arcticus]